MVTCLICGFNAAKGTSFNYADATAYGPALEILQKIGHCVDWLFNFILLPAVLP